MAPEREEYLGNNYLWDGSGQPNPEIQHLEHALGRFRHSGSVPIFPAIPPSTQPSFWWTEIGRLAWIPRFAAALFVFVAIASGLWLSRLPNSSPRVAREGWVVELEATSQPSDNAVTGTKKSSRLELGEALETDALSKANIAVAEIGRLEVEPMTRLRLLQSGAGRKRIALERGTIHATIWASPGQFVVDTPSAVAVDLGCMYTLQVDDTGNGILRTTLGWVGFHRNGRDSFIPAGAACATHVQTGPGTPYFEDASKAFRSALAELDSAATDPTTREAALGTVLREARDRDALTLWHLLGRVNNAERPSVYDRFAALVPPPTGVTREGILRLDTAMLDSWWNALDLGNISLWRHWEQSWTGRESQPR
jgi:FecR protein